MDQDQDTFKEYLAAVAFLIRCSYHQTYDHLPAHLGDHADHSVMPPKAINLYILIFLAPKNKIDFELQCGEHCW